MKKKYTKEEVKLKKEEKAFQRKGEEAVKIKEGTVSYKKKNR